MEDCCVHHVEIGVRNGEEFQRRFIQQYKFSLCATRCNDRVKQWVLQSGNATVLLTEPASKDLNVSVSSDMYCFGWLPDGTPVSCENDSVFNVALKVKDLKVCVDKLTRSNVHILRDSKTLCDEYGKISFAVVKSCIGNVVHTLIEDNGYKGVFLPEFKPVDQINKCTLETRLVTHFDHVTFACDVGESDNILEWYARYFGMRRFVINKDDNEDDGFVIDTEDIGLRLKAFEYWKCAETGLSSGSHPESIKFVIAEALPNQGPNQIGTFLHDHGGSGIQHIGLHTNNIISTVAELKQNGVEFAEPPYTYYTEVGKFQEICDIGQDVDILRENGILVDAEADIEEANSQSQDNSDIRYLLQKFTKPLFVKNTFFLEVIQRVGARGFGSGNITALWRSVQAYMSGKKKEKTGNS